MDADPNDFQKSFLARNSRDYNQIKSNQTAASVSALNHFIFNENKTFKNTSKLARQSCAVFPSMEIASKKYIEITWNFRWSNFTSKEVHQNYDDFLPIEITSEKARRNDVEFSPIKITSKKFAKR